VCKDLKYVSIKSIEVDLQKCIIYPMKFGKGRQKWNKACLETSIYPRKLNTLVKSK